MGEESVTVERYAQLAASPQAVRTKTQVIDAFSQGGSVLNDGEAKGNLAVEPVALERMAWTLWRAVSHATPAAILQTLQNIAIPAGGQVAGYVSEWWPVVANV